MPLNPQPLSLDRTLNRIYLQIIFHGSLDLGRHQENVHAAIICLLCQKPQRVLRVHSGRQNWGGVDLSCLSLPLAGFPCALHTLETASILFKSSCSWVMNCWVSVEQPLVCAASEMMTLLGETLCQ